MEYRRLGASGLMVSPICVGADIFGKRTSAAVSSKILGAAFDAGINFIDTADTYSNGDSERIVGRAIAKRRDFWVLATKVSHDMDARDPNAGGLSRKWIIRAVHASLKRLGTDYIDIYYLHHDHIKTPLDETLRAMEDLIRAGYIRYFGVSNFQGWRIAEVYNASQRLGMAKPIVVQPYYNALYRLAEVEILPACNYYGMGVAVYSPLARGVLSGKYLPGKTPPKESRLGKRQWRFMASENREESLVVAQKLKTHAEKRKMSLVHFALNWLLNNSLVTSIIAGPRTYSQWLEYLAALQQPFDAVDEAVVDKLVPRGHSSTPHFTDPKFPVTGRVPIVGAAQ